MESVGSNGKAAVGGTDIGYSFALRGHGTGRVTGFRVAPTPPPGRTRDRTWDRTSDRTRGCRPSLHGQGQHLGLDQ